MTMQMAYQRRHEKRAKKNPEAFIEPDKSRVYMIQGNRGCIPEDEFVYTPNGVITTKNVQHGMNTIDGVVVEPYRFVDDVYEVEINKIKFRATGEHPIYITKDFPFRHNPKFEAWVKIEDIYQSYSKKPKKNKWYAQANLAKCYKFNEISVGLNFAKLLGYLMSDGYFSEKQSVKFTNVNKDLLLEVTSLAMNVSEQFGISVKNYQKGNGQDLMLTGIHGISFSKLKDKLRELDVIERNSFGNLQILEEGELIEFLKGYFNGDGNLYTGDKNSKARPVITFYVGIHKKMAYELQFMLWRLGINSLIDFRKRKEGHLGCWEVEVSESRSLRKLIRILDTRKYPDKFNLALKKLSKIKNTSDHYQTEFYQWLPITKIKKVGRKKVVGWEIYPTQEITSYCGLRTHNSGKSSLDEFIALMNYKMGHTILDIHSASNYESLFWAINLNCRDYYKKLKEIENAKPKHLRKKIPPHCNCHERFPILLVVPEYVEIDKEALDKFNGNRYYTLKQWIDEGNDPKDYRIKTVHPDGHISSEPRENPNFKEWIKVRKLHVPNKGFKNRDIFVEELTNIMLLGQKERRIIATNPKFYNKVQHKLKVLEQMVREVPEIVSSHFKPLNPYTCAKLRGQEEPVAWEDFTTQERNYHRVTVVMREFGSIASANLNEETNQVIVKKALFGWIKVCRQFRMSGVFDFQRFGDVYGGIKDQRDVFIWKRSNIDIFPKEYDWLKKDITEKRIEEIENIGVQYATKEYPAIEDLKDNEMYVLYSEKTPTGKRWKKMFVPMPSFHHRQEDDDFEELTPLVKETQLTKGTWRFITKTKDGELTDTAKDEQREDKKMLDATMEKVWQTVHAWKNPTDKSKRMKDQEIFDKLKELNMLPDHWTGLPQMKMWYSRNKKKFGAKPA